MGAVFESVVRVRCLVRVGLPCLSVLTVGVIDAVSCAFLRWGVGVNTKAEDVGAWTEYRTCDANTLAS